MSPRLVLLLLFLVDFNSGCLSVGQVNECGCAPGFLFKSQAFWEYRFPELAANYTNFYPLTYTFLANCTRINMQCYNSSDVFLYNNNNNYTEYRFQPGFYYSVFANCQKDTYLWKVGDLNWDNIGGSSCASPRSNI